MDGLGQRVQRQLLRVDGDSARQRGGGYLRTSRTRSVIVDYTDAVAAFFIPRQEGAALPVAVAEGSPARRLRDACEPVAMHAGWSRATNERLAQLGLDFLTSYVGGRGPFLGEPAVTVVAPSCRLLEPSLRTA